MYVKCGCMQRAREVFDGTIHKDVVTWNSVILGYVENGESSKAMELFATMDCEPSHVTYIGALKACAGLAVERRSEKHVVLERGMALHRELESRRFESNTLVANTLVDMYGKCGSMRHAWVVFQRMTHKSVVTWNSLMLGYVENGESSRALDLFKNLGCERSHVSYIAALKACASLATENESEKARTLETGISIHKQLKESGLESNLVLGNTLLDMYGKCGSMQHARRVFEKMIRKDVVTWTCLIMGYVENGENLVALNLFRELDCLPDAVTYIAALKACGGLANEREGRTIHEEVKSRRFDTNVTIGNAVIDMYRKCGSVQLAKEVFDTMVKKDVVSWTCLIMGHVESGESFRALELFSRMDCEPHSFTYVAVLKAYGNLASEDKRLSLRSVAAVHDRIRECGYDSNVYVANTLIEMYGKCGCMSSAQEVFDKMVHRNVFSWTCLLVGYVDNGESNVAMECFASMDCEPDSFTYAVALKACGVAEGMRIHKRLTELGFDSDVVVAGALVGMYIRCRRMHCARDVFERMGMKSVITWTSLIMGYVGNGESSTGMQLFKRMDCEPDRFAYVAALKACEALEDGIGIHRRLEEFGFGSDMIVGSSLLDMYRRCGSMERARGVFEGRTERDVVMWNSLLHGYVENGGSSEALKLFMGMECTADSCTYVAVLKACGCLSALHLGRAIHARVCGIGLEGDGLVGTALLDFYGRCGSMSAAEEVFNTMPSPDIVSFTALLGGYAALGETHRVFDLVRCVGEAGLQVNAATLTCILTACSRSGMLGDGIEIVNRYGIDPSLEHYACMVDMLGRANRLEEALSIVRNMPMKANSVTWTSLLDACRRWKNVEVAKVAFDALVELDEQRGTTYVLMGEIYGV